MVWGGSRKPGRTIDWVSLQPVNGMAEEKKLSGIVSVHSLGVVWRGKLLQNYIYFGGE